MRRRSTKTSRIRVRELVYERLRAEREALRAGSVDLLLLLLQYFALLAFAVVEAKPSCSHSERRVCTAV